MRTPKDWSDSRFANLERALRRSLDVGSEPFPKSPYAPNTLQADPTEPISGELVFGFTFIPGPDGARFLKAFAEIARYLVSKNSHALASAAAIIPTPSSNVWL